MPTVKTLQGHVLERLRELPENSIQCVVTSPPYWSLRDYSICQCAQTSVAMSTVDGGRISSDDDRCKKEPDPNCPACHGTGHIKEVAKHQIGLEKTPQEYVQKIVEVFEEIRRVLRPDGTCWVNLGSSYCGSGCGGSDSGIQVSNLASVSDDKQTIQSLQRRNGSACGNDDTKLQDSHAPGFSCFDLCDGCRDSFLNDNVHNDQLREQWRQLSEKKTCKCETNERKPCVILDPFGGSGTTGQVALEEGRDAILIELNPGYIPLIEQRTNITPGLML